MSERAAPREVGSTAEEGSKSGWAAEDMYRLLSVPLLVRSTHVGFVEALRWHLAPFRRAEPIRGTGAAVVDVYERDGDGDVQGADAATYVGFTPYVYARDGATQRVASLTGVLAFALWDANSLVTSRSRDFLFLHAGSVVRGGEAILLPAMMDVGKSTLVTALLERGFDYLSDELGVIDPVTRRAYPFERRITLDPDALRFFPGLKERLDDRNGASAELPQRYVRPEDVSAAVSLPAPIRRVVFLGADRQGPPRVSTVGRSELVHSLVNHAFNLGTYGERGMVLLSKVAREATGYRLDGGTPSERAEAITDLL